MVGLKIIDSSAAFPVDPAIVKKAETNKMVKWLPDPTEGAKLSDHSFVFPESVSHEQVEIAYGLLDKLLGECGGELRMDSPSEISHVKSGITVSADLSKFIQHGIFLMAPFIESVKKDLQAKSAVFAIMGDVSLIKLKGDYSESFNLSTWFSTKM